MTGIQNTVDAHAYQTIVIFYDKFKLIFKTYTPIQWNGSISACLNTAQHQQHDHYDTF